MRGPARMMCWALAQRGTKMCDCVKRFDEWLSPHNGRIAMAMQVTEEMDLRARLCIATEKLDKSKRKPVPLVMANYCPFCGEKMVPNVKVRG